MPTYGSQASKDRMEEMVSRVNANSGGKGTVLKKAINKAKKGKSKPGRRKEGKFITTQYTQPAQTTKVTPAGEDIEKHSQTVESLTTNVYDKNTGEHIADKKTESPFTIDHGTTLQEGDAAKTETSTKRQYQDQVSEVHRKKKNKALSKATGKDVYDVNIKKAVKHTTSMDGGPRSYTFEKYDKFGDIKKSKTKEVKGEKQGDRLADKAQRFTGSKRIVKNTAQKDSKLISEGAHRGAKGGTTTGVLGTGKEKVDAGRDTFQQRVKDYQTGTAEDTHVQREAGKQQRKKKKSSRLAKRETK